MRDDHPTKVRWILWVLTASAAIGIAAAAGVFWWPKPLPEPEKTFPLPAYSKSPYLNTEPGVQHIGTAACAACHPGKHQSYLHTAHSRALSEVDPSTEPPNGSCDHKASGRSYRVYRKDNQMRHEEVVKSDDSQTMCRNDQLDFFEPIHAPDHLERL